MFNGVQVEMPPVLSYRGSDTCMTGTRRCAVSSARSIGGKKKKKNKKEKKMSMKK